MTYQTVYDLNGKRFAPYYAFPFPFLVVFLLVLILSILFDFFSVEIRVSLGFISVAFSILSLINFFQMIADEKYIFKPYRENNCEVIEGIVTDFSPKSRAQGCESFNVSGMTFKLPNSSSKVGYNTLCSKGGVIKGDGQNVRITYVYNKMLGTDNVIVKIEIAEAD